MNYLNTINSPQDLKKLEIHELDTVAKEIREAVLNRDSKIGGHVGPNLGIVETTIALHYVFNSPQDKIVFDVSHQCYPHKILTGRQKGFIGSDEEIATVNSNGIVTGVAPGKVTITIYDSYTDTEKSVNLTIRK